MAQIKWPRLIQKEIKLPGLDWREKKDERSEETSRSWVYRSSKKVQVRHSYQEETKLEEKMKQEKYGNLFISLI